MVAIHAWNMCFFPVNLFFAKKFSSSVAENICKLRTNQAKKRDLFWF